MKNSIFKLSVADICMLGAVLESYETEIGSVAFREKSLIMSSTKSPGKLLAKYQSKRATIKQLVFLTNREFHRVNVRLWAEALETFKFPDNRKPSSEFQAFSFHIQKSHELNLSRGRVVPIASVDALQSLTKAQQILKTTPCSKTEIEHKSRKIINTGFFTTYILGD